MQRLNHLVIVVPGIGGSVLQTPSGAARWNEQRRRLLHAAMRPGRLALDAEPALVPVDLIPDIRLVGPFVVPGYADLVRKIRNNFADVRMDISRPDRAPDHRADLVLFPYDFRLGVQHAAERLAADITARLSGAGPGGRSRRVIVVAHSMGGLVARYWLGPLGGAADCAALITLGTPHRGAPKALDVLVNGLAVGPKRLAGMTELLRSWPSVYELLPRYRSVARADGDAKLYPYELDGLGITALGPTFLTRARQAFRVHQDIEHAWEPLAAGNAAPDLIPVYARGHATLHRAVLSAAGKVTVTKDPPDWLPNPDWHGDGTVPAISAIPIEAEGSPVTWRGQPERHMALASSAAVLDILASYTGASLSPVRGEEPDRPWLGLDLDETAAAGHPVPVTVTLRGAQADERTKVHVRIRARGGEARQTSPWLPCAAAGEGRWQTEIDPPAPGPYEVEVSATGVPHVGRLQAGDFLGVVDSDFEDQHEEKAL